MQKIEIKGLNEYIYKGVCDNGLEVYVWQNEKLKSTYMALSVLYGSIDTEFKIKNKTHKVPNGTAHFLEHIKFNESDGKTAHDFYNELGSSVNAFTTFKYTSYYVSALDRIDENLNHLLDFVQTPVFTSKIVQKEKGIIIEEANMGEDTPENLAYFELNKSLFKYSNYRNYITGTKEDIKAISLEDVNLVFDNFYTPNNMFLCVTGNVNPYEIFEIVKNNQNKKEFKKANKVERISKKEPFLVNRTHKELKANINNPFGYIALKYPKKVFKKYTDLETIVYLDLLFNMNFSSTSKFKEDLLNQKLLTTLDHNISINEDYIVIRICFDSKYFDEVSKIIIDKLNNLNTNEEDFKRKQKSVIASLILDYDSAERINSMIQRDIIFFGEILKDIKIFFESITYKDIVDIKNILSFDNITTLSVIPKD